VTVDGRERTFRRYLPGDAPAGPRPLVVVLHGALGTGTQAESAYGWNAEAARAGFVVAYPDGVGRTWAAGPGCCGPAARDGVDDVAFLEAVVTAVGAEVPLDPDRIYLAGISNGGMLAYRAACAGGSFAAIGVVAGTLVGPCPAPRPISVLHIHGTADRTVPYDGGPGLRDNDGTGRNPVKIDGPPVTELVGRWRSAAGCPAPEVCTEGPVTRSTADCPGGRAVELITIAGAGHQWPGSAVPDERIRRLLNLDPPSTALDATATLWQFFAAHPRPPA
jgi:polyhydroxybutyrate depolymerase